MFVWITLKATSDPKRYDPPSPINIFALGKLKSKNEPRTVNTKYGETQVCDAMLEDDSGEIKLTLWGDDIPKVNVGDTISITDGYTNTFKDEVSINKSRSGKLEVINE